MPSKKLTTRQRVEQAVKKEYQKWLDGGCKSAGWLTIAIACTLAERRRIRREVRKMKRAHMNKSYMNALDDILTRLRG